MARARDLDAASFVAQGDVDFDRYGAFDLRAIDPERAFFLRLFNGVQVLHDDPGVVAYNERIIASLYPSAGENARDVKGWGERLHPMVIPRVVRGLDFKYVTLRFIQSAGERIWSYGDTLSANRDTFGQQAFKDLNLSVVRRPDVEQFMREHQRQLTRLGLIAELD